MTIYNVYEKRNDGRSYIGTVEAESNNEAISKALNEYGGPVKVEEQ